MRKRRIFGRSASTASDVPDAPLSSPGGGVRVVNVSPSGTGEPQGLDKEMEPIEGTGTATGTMLPKVIPSPDTDQPSIQESSSRKRSSRRQSV